MVDFVAKKSITTKEPMLTVDPGLPEGIYTFQLIVVDNSGNQSKPAEIEVTITKPTVPRTPLSPVTPIIRSPIG